MPVSAPATANRPPLPPRIRTIHLTAICGTAMGSLAGMLKEAGYDVRGSDTQVYPPMSTFLGEMGISIMNGFSPDHLNLDPKPDLVVIGNAVSRDNPEVEAVFAHKLPYLSMPECLSRFFLADRLPVVITGTHGKTTTSSLVAWLLDQGGLDPSFLIGGVVQNFAKSYKLGKGRHFVIEGDEYDTAFFDKGPKFYHYRPHIATITSLEFDHADIFPDLESIEGHFARFSALLPAQGALFICSHYPNIERVSTACPARRVRYGLSGDEDITAKAVSEGPDGTAFELVRGGRASGTWHSPLSGTHNLLNTLVAIGIASELGIPDARIQAALATFTGVKRRQEVRGVAGGVTIIDDFAHHPTAVRETIRAVRRRYPEARLWAVFEPRSNSSIRAVFQEDYERSLAEADRVSLAPVFRPEKVKDGRVLDVDAICTALNRDGEKARRYPNADAIVADLKLNARRGDVILVMSNGGFDNIHTKLLDAIKDRP